MKSIITYGSLVILSQCSNLKQNYYYYTPSQPTTTSFYPQNLPTIGTTNRYDDTTSQQVPQGGMQSTSNTYTDNFSYENQGNNQGTSEVITSIPSTNLVTTPTPITTTTTLVAKPNQSDVFALLAATLLQSNNNPNSNLNASLLTSLFPNLTSNSGNNLGSIVNSSTASTNSQNIVVSTTASDHSNANTNMNSNAISGTTSNVTPTSTYNNNAYINGYYRSSYPIISGNILNQPRNIVSSKAISTNSQSAAVNTNANGHSNASTNLNNNAYSSNNNGLNTNYSDNDKNSFYRAPLTEINQAYGNYPVYYQ